MFWKKNDTIIETITAAAAAAYSINVSAIKNGLMFHDVAHARQLACYLVGLYTKIDQTRRSYTFGNNNSYASKVDTIIKRKISAKHKETVYSLALAENYIKKAGIKKPPKTFAEIVEPKKAANIILKVVCKHFNVTLSELRYKRREEKKKVYIWICYMLRTLAELPLRTIGGYVDCSVSHVCKCVQKVSEMRASEAQPLIEKLTKEIYNQAKTKKHVL